MANRKGPPARRQARDEPQVEAQHGAAGSAHSPDDVQGHGGGGFTRSRAPGQNAPDDKDVEGHGGVGLIR